MTYEFCIDVSKVSGVGKNNYGITKTGIHYPKKNFVLFRNDFITQLKKEIDRKNYEITTITEPVKLTLWYKPLDKRKRDATAILDAIFNILETCRIISDDSLIKKIDYQETESIKNVFYLKIEKLYYEKDN